MEKKKGCSSCKKPKEVKLEPVQKIDLDIYVPTIDEIITAYHELTSYGGVKEDKKEMIQKVYQTIFNEEFNFGCNSCVSTQARKFQHYIKTQLKINV